MKKRPNVYQVMRNLTYITQVGISLVVPIALSILFTSWLQRRFDMGSWIVLIGILFGIGSSACTLQQFFRYVTKEAKESEKEHRKYTKGD